jgi:hypothetical protein
LKIAEVSYLITNKNVAPLGQAQVTPSPITSPSSTNTTVSPALKSKICDPNNPKLRFVNTTESNICGIPKTIKNVTTTTPTPEEILDYHTNITQ